MCSYSCRPVRLAAALHTACDTADAASQPGTRTSAGSSGMTTAATALPLPLYHNHVAYSANQWHHWKNTNHVLLMDATLTSYHAVRRYAPADCGGSTSTHRWIRCPHSSGGPQGSSGAQHLGQLLHAGTDRWTDRQTDGWIVASLDATLQQGA